MENEEKTNNEQINNETIAAVSQMFPKGELAKEVSKRKSKKQEQPKQEVQQVVEQKEQQVEQKEVIETPFFKFEAQSSKAEESNMVDLRDWNNLIKYAKDEGFEIKDPNDLANVFKAIKEKDTKVKEYEPKVEELSNKIKVFEDIFSNAPADAVNPLIAWARGEDYKAKIREVQEAPFDVTLDVSKHDELSLVNYFGDDKYTKEEWDDLEEKAQKNLLKSAKQLYNVKQSEVLSYRTKTQNEQLERQNKFVKSVDDEITRLKAKYPDMTEKDLRDVRTSMLGGINKMLFNDDGTYRQGAADRIAMAVHGEKTLGQMKDVLMAKMNAEKNKLLSTEREKILVTGNENVNLGRGDDSKKKLDDELKRRTDFLKHVNK